MEVSDTAITYYITPWEDLVRQYESPDIPQLQALPASGFLSGACLLPQGCITGKDAAYMPAAGGGVTAPDMVQADAFAANQCPRFTAMIPAAMAWAA